MKVVILLSHFTGLNVGEKAVTTSQNVEVADAKGKSSPVVHCSFYI